MLNPNALVNVRAVRRYMSDPQLEEAKVQEAINAYSDAIQQWLGRQFMPLEGDPLATPDPVYVAKTFVAYAAGSRVRVDFDRPGEATELLGLPQSIEINGDRDYAATLEPASYRLIPRGKTAQGTYFGLHLPLYPADPYGTEIEVTGVWGAGVVPPALRGAVLIAIADGLRNPEGAASRTLGELGIVESNEGPAAGERSGAFLPPDARQMCMHLRRTPTAP